MQGDQWAYTVGNVAVFGDASLNERAIELYRRWWDLADSAVYIALFRNPHDRDGNTGASWENLTHCLASLSGA